MNSWYHDAFIQGQLDWEQHYQLDDNPFLDINSEQYIGWMEGWISMNKYWNPNWYKNKEIK